jgi:hypothetical protein
MLWAPGGRFDSNTEIKIDPYVHEEKYAWHTGLNCVKDRVLKLHFQLVLELSGFIKQGT